jgi:hypothetical protein
MTIAGMQAAVYSLQFLDPGPQPYKRVFLAASMIVQRSAWQAMQEARPLSRSRHLWARALKTALPNPARGST